MAVMATSASGLDGLEKVREAMLPSSSSSTEAVHWPEERAVATRAEISVIAKKSSSKYSKIGVQTCVEVSQCQQRERRGVEEAQVGKARQDTVRIARK